MATQLSFYFHDLAELEAVIESAKCRDQKNKDQASKDARNERRSSSEDARPEHQQENCA